MDELRSKLIRLKFILREREKPGGGGRADVCEAIVAFWFLVQEGR